MRTTATEMDAAGRHDLDAFTRMAEAAYRGLPREVRELCGEIVVEVAEFARPEVLRQMRLASRYDLLGLFEGIGMAHAGAAPFTGQMPNRIWLYRQPILAYAEETGETVEAVVTHVLVHEIGHHFGLSDDDMYEIDDSEDD